jgi:hypothetical protein
MIGSGLAVGSLGVGWSLGFGVWVLVLTFDICYLIFDIAAYD